MASNEHAGNPAVITIPATEARNHFGEVLKRVYRDGEQLVVEKDGLPIAAIMSHAEFTEYRRLKSLALLEQLNRRVNRELEAQGYSEEQSLVELRAIKEAAHAQTYVKRKPRRKQNH